MFVATLFLLLPAVLHGSKEGQLRGSTAHNAPRGYLEHTHTNCYEGHGGAGTAEPISTSVEGCASHGSPCFVYFYKTSQCFLRDWCSSNLDRCERGVPGQESWEFSTFVQGGPAPVPGPTPAPGPSPTPSQCANGNMYQDCGYWGITRSECEARGCCYTEHIGPKQKKCYPRGSNPTPPPTPHYRIFSGYECKDGYDAIPTPGECNEAAKSVQHTRLTVNTNVPSASVNPHGCYLYGSSARGFSNLYFNYAGKTSGSWENRNVICKIGA
jgi:hypothetical protein